MPARGIGVLGPVKKHAGTSLRRLLRSFGPGIITGAADDDPSGIATYSIAGAQLGTGLLWTAPLTWPLMAAVQTTCARVGMVTGGGLMRALRSRFPRRVLLVGCVALFVANTINVGADLAGMGDAARLLTGADTRIWVVVFGALIAWFTIRLRYPTFARVLKWLSAALFAYVIAAFAIGPDWRAVLHATLVPSLPGRGAWATLVAILGTTISPYLFFWQAAEEVEEDKRDGKRRLADRIGASDEALAVRRIDVALGTGFSNLVMYFIILTTGLTLHRHGMTNPTTSAQVAEALRPLAGRFAALLYTLGLLGTGALAIPTLAGSAAYASAEIFEWRQGMDERLAGARRFYGVFAASIALGVGLVFAGVNPVKALYWSAVINGALAPFLLVGLLVVASDHTLMVGQPSSRLARGTVAVTAAAMFAAAIAMVIL